MNAERLAEIRGMTKANAWKESRTVIVSELLDHIAQLEAQRGELARELDLTKREAWTAKERYKDEKDRADGLRERLDELNAEEFAKAQRGGAVVVPAMTNGDCHGILSKHCGGNDMELRRLHEAYRLAVSRIQPIPASQVLQTGEVGVDREELEDLRHTVRFLAKQEDRTYKIRSEAMSLFGKKEYESASDLIVMHWPIVQGLQNQLDLAKVGKQPYDTKRIRPAIDRLLRSQAGGEG